MARSACLSLPGSEIPQTDVHQDLLCTQTQSAAVLRKGRKIVMDRLEKRNGLRGSAYTANKRKEPETNDVSDSKRRADSEPLNILYSRLRRAILLQRSVKLGPSKQRKLPVTRQ